jgi:hypothetical protein
MQLLRGHRDILGRCAVDVDPYKAQRATNMRVSVAACPALPAAQKRFDHNRISLADTGDAIGIDNGSRELVSPHDGRNDSW